MELDFGEFMDNGSTLSGAEDSTVKKKCQNFCGRKWTKDSKDSEKWTC